MRTHKLSSTELLVLTIVQETSLNTQKAGDLFDQFEKEHAPNDRKLTQTDIRKWIVSLGVEILSVLPKK
jgi:hypothetical protein